MAVNSLAQITLLQSELKPRLVEQLEKFLDSDGTKLNTLLEEAHGHFQTILPKPLLRRFEAGDGQVKLDEWSLLELIELIRSCPRLSAYFKREKCNRLTAVQETLLDLYCLHARTVAGAEANTAELEKTESDIRETLLLFGVDDDQITESFAKQCTETTEDDNNKSGVMEDELFRLLYLKRAREFELDSVKALKEKAAVELDSFYNLRRTIADALKPHLECHICQQLLVDPRTLPCLHYSCLECMKQRRSDTDKTLTCMECNRRIAAPEETSIDAYPCHFFLKNIYDLYQVLIAPEDGAVDDVSLECSKCIKPANCLEASTGMLYCDYHRAPIYHNNKQPPSGGQSFSFISATDLLKADFVEDELLKHCPQHSAPLEYFCTICRVPCCKSNACLNWHAQHGETTSLADVCRANREEIKRFGGQLWWKAQKTKGALARAERNQLEVAELQETVRGSIEQYFDEMAKELDARRRDCLRRLDAAAESCWEHDEHQRRVLTAFNAKVTEVQADALRLLSKDDVDNHRSEQQLALRSSHVIQTLKGLLIGDSNDSIKDPLMTDVLTLSYPETGLRNLMQNVVNLNINVDAVGKAKGWEPVVRADGLRTFLVLGGRIFMIIRTILYGPQIVYSSLDNLKDDPVLFCNAEVTGLAMSSCNNLLALRDVQHSVDLMRMKLKHAVYVVQYKVPPKEQPQQQPQTMQMSMASVIGMQPAPEQMRAMGIEHLSSYNNCMLKTPYESVYWSCSPSVGDGATTTEKSPLILLGDNHTVLEITVDNGRILRKFDFHTLVDITDFAPVPDRDLLVVVETIQDRVLIFDCQQRTMVAVGEKGDGPRELSNPSAVAVDQFGHIFIADTGNNRVQVFTLSGEALKSIPYPPAIIADPNHSPLTSVTGGRIPQIGKRSTKLQVAGDYLYLFENRCDSIFRLHYL